MHKMRIEHSIVLESKEVPTEGKWKITGEEGKWKITGEEKKRKKKHQDGVISKEHGSQLEEMPMIKLKAFK